MTVAAALVALLWLVQLLLAIRVVRSIPPLSTLAPKPTGRWPKVSLLVPARDEASGIEGALRSKLASGYPELELIAIDDRSRDQTGAILDRIGASDPRVRVLHLESLPEGWLGKLHAMQRGFELATGEWILFSDADVHLEPGVLERLIAHGEQEAIDVLAVFPRMGSVNLILDAGVVGMLRVLFLSGRSWGANDDRSSVALGVGAFNLVRKSALERTRAIEGLRMEIADDVGLAAMIKQSGGRCRVFAGREEVHLIFLDSIRSAVRSASKGGGWFKWTFWIPIAAVIVPLTIELALPIAASFAGGAAAIFGALALALATATHLCIARHFRAPIRGALLWPIGNLLSSVLMLYAGLRAWRHQGVWWRDTFYPRAVLDGGRRMQLPSMRIQNRT